MNDFELETRLKKVPLPQHSEKYWEHFPDIVQRRLHRKIATTPAVEHGFPRMFVTMSFRFACLAVIVFIAVPSLRAASCVLSKNERIIRKELAQLPKNLKIFMADEHGMHDLAAE